MGLPLTNRLSKRIGLNIPPLLWVFGLVLAVLVLLDCLNPAVFSHSIFAVTEALFNTFGFVYLGVTTLMLMVFIAIGLSPLGKIRLGGPNAKPTHGFWSWFSMLFCAGMGTGMMYWGATEPLYHFMNPPAVLAHAADGVKATNAFGYTFLHWGVHPWVIYGLTALMMGLMGFNLKKGFWPGNWVSGPLLKRWIDAVTLLAIVVGVSASFGMGIVHFAGGLKALFGVPGNGVTYSILAALMTGAFLTSCLLGVDRGIKPLSIACMILNGVLLLALVILVPQWISLPELVKDTTHYLAEMGTMGLGIGAYTNPVWIRDWTTKYWSWWIAWAPFVGLFVALISRGYTVRQLVFGCLLAPTLYSLVWFGLFGQSALGLQTNHHWFGTNLPLEETQAVLFRLLEWLYQTPLAKMVPINWSAFPVLTWLSMAIIAINFINSADSATYSVATVSYDQTQQAFGEESNEEAKHEIVRPPVWLQITWGLIFAGVALLCLLSGGISLLQEITLLTTFPFMLILVGLLTWFVSLLCKYPKAIARGVLS